MLAAGTDRRAARAPWALAAAAGVGLGLAAPAVAALPGRWALLALPLALAPLAAVAAGGVERLLIALILLDIPLQLDVNLAYREDLARYGELGGWNLSLTTLAVAGLSAIWLVRATAQPAPPAQRYVMRWSAPLAVYAAVVLLSPLTAQDRGAALFEAALALQLLLAHIYVASAIRTRRDLLFVVGLLALGLACEGALMAALRATGGSLSLPGVRAAIVAARDGGGFTRRVVGTLGTPNIAASYLSLLLPVSLALLLAPVGRPLRWLGAAALGIGGVALALTFSRGGWVAAGAALALLCWGARRRGALPLAIPAALGIGVLALAVIFRAEVETRMAAGINGRLPLLELAWLMIRDHPLLGVGANNFAALIDAYASPHFGRSWLYAVHNKYLLVWAETGAAGLLAYLWFLGAALAAGWRVARGPAQLEALLGLGLAASLAGYMVHMLVDLFSGRMPAQLVVVMAAILVALDAQRGGAAKGGEGAP
jgi:O-antigen ligase